MSLSVPATPTHTAQPREHHGHKETAAGTAIVPASLPPQLGGRPVSTTVAALTQVDWPATIMEVVAYYYDMDMGTMLAKGPGSREPFVVEARSVVALLLDWSGYTRTLTGQLLGRDHSTVWHHLCKLVEYDDPALEEAIVSLHDGLQKIGCPFVDERPRPVKGVGTGKKPGHSRALTKEGLVAHAPPPPPLAPPPHGAKAPTANQGACTLGDLVRSDVARMRTRARTGLAASASQARVVQPW